MQGTEDIPHVVVLGGGFGGLTAVRALKRSKVRVTLVDRGNHHLFQPLLYQVATAGLAAPSVAAPLRHVLRRQRNLTVLMATVARIDIERRRVQFDGGDGLDYDYLVVATGAGHAYFGHDEWARHAPGLKHLGDALHIRRHLLRAFERAERTDDAAERDAQLTFVVVGAGPTGVELAGSLAEIARHTLHGEFRRADPRRARVLLAEAGKRVLPALHPSLSKRAQAQLERLGVEVRTDAAVEDIDADGAVVGGERVRAGSVLWAAGVAASPLGACLAGDRDRAGRVTVREDLSLPGHPEVLVAGDLARFEQDGAPVPGIAPAAKQMGRHAAKVLEARLQDKAAPAFRYRDQGQLATIGRMAAVAQFGRLRLSGPFAWWVWLLAHIAFLIGFRNRLVVLVDWAWAYFSHARNARIVIAPHGDQDGSD